MQRRLHDSTVLVALILTALLAALLAGLRADELLRRYLAKRCCNRGGSLVQDTSGLVDLFRKCVVDAGRDDVVVEIPGDAMPVVGLVLNIGLVLDRRIRWFDREVLWIQWVQRDDVA